MPDAAATEFDDDVSAGLEDVPHHVPLGPPPRAISLLQRQHNKAYCDIGAMNVPCTWCAAYHWVDERVGNSPASRPVFNSCCLNGEVELPSFQPLPRYLHQLLTDLTAPARAFRKHLRAYNSAFAFVSLKTSQTTRGVTSGVQMFQIHGALYHQSGPIEPPQGQLPRYAQLYFHDPQYASATRQQLNTHLDLSTLQGLTEMLHEIKNPYISLYLTARERINQAGTGSAVLLTSNLQLVLETGPDRRRENIPTSDEVALILPDAAAAETSRPVTIAARDSPALFTISAAHPSYMPLHYVLMFPNGDSGWAPGLALRNREGARVRHTISQQQYYRYYLHPRAGQTTVPFRFYRLFQQYVVDVWAICDQARLAFIRENQRTIRAELYSGVADALLQRNPDNSDAHARIGRRTVLPSSYIGGSRFVSQCYQDSMAIVRRYGRPTLFITFTASSYWQEVNRELREGETGLNRPDLVCRAFRLKAKELLRDVRSGRFGTHLGHVYTIEYQKRGLPHIHLLLFLTPDDREAFTTAEHIDRFIRAEIPTAAEDPDGLLTDLVRTFMIHGPCGEHNPTAPCMVAQSNGLPRRCSKGFPRSYSPITVVHEDGYPEYQRRNDGRTITVTCKGRTVLLDNAWVVPYSPQVLLKYWAHINMEVCGTIHAIKYVHKYIYKGTDRASLTVADNDEVLQHLSGRYISPSEAIWRLFEYPVHEEYPPVEHLAVHLPDQQLVSWPETHNDDQLRAHLERSASTLTAFFKYNATSALGRHLLYQDFPSQFVYVKATRTWQPRQRGTAIGRMYFCNPLQGERYYLRLLLTVVRGPASFEDLRTLDGVVYPTFQAAASARGLLQHDGDWVACFRDAVTFTTGRALRHFFVAALMNGPVTDPLAIWTQFRSDLCDDLTLDAAALTVSSDPNVHLDYGLYLIETLLTEFNKRLTDFGLPSCIHNWGLRDTNPLLAAELSYNQAEQDNVFFDTYHNLNSDQLAVFNAVVDHIRNDPHTAHYFVQGPAGTGKTFLWQCLCAYYRSQGCVVLCVASSGIAAVLLPGGRTAHSRFKIPLDIHEDSTCPVAPNSPTGRLLQAATLVIWDEVPMQHRYCFDAVHRMLQDVRNCPAQFGGLPLIASGDFAQILSVVKRGSRAAVVDACLQSSTLLWPSMTVLHLRQNMRVLAGEDNARFAAWSRSLSTPSMDGPVPIPDWVRVYYSREEFQVAVYPTTLLAQAVTTFDCLAGRAILAVRNDAVAAINADLLACMPGEVTELLAVDTAHVEDETTQDLPPVELLQSFEPPSLPPSRLRLKVGAPIILLRNLYPSQGLCNGTRLVVTRLQSRCIEAQILSGEFAGQVRLISRIKLTSTDGELPFVVQRVQFPVRLSFAITINKSQGQSLSTVGVDLRHQVFTHGQFYVALSRVTTLSGLTILLPHVPTEDSNVRTAVNIVYPEVILPYYLFPTPFSRCPATYVRTPSLIAPSHPHDYFCLHLCLHFSFTSAFTSLSPLPSLTICFYYRLGLSTSVLAYFPTSCDRRSWCRRGTIKAASPPR